MPGTITTWLLSIILTTAFHAVTISTSTTKSGLHCKDFKLGFLQWVAAFKPQLTASISEKMRDFYIMKKN